MIEVEKKFRPTDEQLNRLLEDAEFLGEKILKDQYYDYSDYHLFKNFIYFRNRNGNFELKIGDDEIEGTCEEIENEEQIKKYFKTTKSLQEFVEDNLIPTISWVCKRKKYKKAEFSIDIDELDFGYKCVEVEILVASQSEVEQARRNIVALAERYKWEIKDVPAKRKEYFRIVKPEIYKKLYPLS